MSHSTLTEFTKRRTPDWRRLSDPAIYRTLHLAALVGCFLGLLLFARYEAERIARLDSIEMNVWAETIAPGIEVQLEQGKLLAKNNTVLVEDVLNVDLNPKRRRNAKASVEKSIFESTASGIAIIKPGGEVLETFGEVPVHGYLWPQSERTVDSEVELMKFVSGDEAYIAYRPGIFSADDTNLVIIYRAGVFNAVLGRATISSLLFNRDGDLLSASAGMPEYASQESLNFLLDIHSVSQSKTGRDQKLSSLDSFFRKAGAQHTNVILTAGEAHIIAFRLRKGPLETLWAYRESLVLLLGPVILAILLTLSLIQNEWRRQDKVDQNSSNMAERARLAGEIMSAGIIDWSVNEGSVSYSEGWANMFGYHSPPQHEEVFDWIERVHPDDKLRARAVYEDLQNGTLDDLSHTIKVRTIDGKYRMVHERGRAHVDATGVDRHIILVQISV